MKTQEEMEKRMREIAEEVYLNQTKDSKYSVSQVPFHTHNGTDSSQIEQKNVIRNIINFGSFTATAGTSTVLLNNIPNGSMVVFSGVAIATGKAAMINGHGYFGRGYDFNLGEELTKTTSGIQGVPFLQMSNFFYLDLTGSPQARTGTTPYLGYADDGAQVARLEIIDYSNAAVTLEATVASGWVLGGNLIIN